MAVATPPRMTLADILLKEGVISDEQHERALLEYDRTKRSIVRILTEMGVLPEDTRINILRRRLNCELVKLRDVIPSAEVSGYVTKDMCRRLHAVPLRLTDGTVLVAMEDPTDMRAIQDLERVYGTSVRAVLASSSDIEETIERFPEVVEPEAGGRTDRGIGYKLTATLSLALLVFGPMMGFLYFISRSKVGLEWYSSFGFGTFENVLVFLVVWGSWAAIGYFLNDLLFGGDSRG